jgi:hypothetical protein
MHFEDDGGVAIVFDRLSLAEIVCCSHSRKVESCLLKENRARTLPAHRANANAVILSGAKRSRRIPRSNVK